MENRIGELTDNRKSGWVDMWEYKKENRRSLFISMEVSLIILDWMDFSHTDRYVLAQKLGMTFGEVSLLLKGHMDMRLSTLVKIEELLGTKIIKIEEDV